MPDMPPQLQGNGKESTARSRRRDERDRERRAAGAADAARGARVSGIGSPMRIFSASREAARSHRPPRAVARGARRRGHLDVIRGRVRIPGRDRSSRRTTIRTRSRSAPRPVRRRLRRDRPADLPRRAARGAARLRRRAEDLADRNWELKEAEERAKSLLEAQGDMIVRRDRDGFITYANDAFSALAGARRDKLIGTADTLPVLEQGDAAQLRRRHPRARPEDQDPGRGALDRLARGGGAGRPGRPRCRASAAMSPTASRPSARSPRRATRPRPQTAPSRASSPWSRTRSARRSTASSAWPIFCIDTPLTPEQATYAKAMKTSGETLLSLIEEILDFSKIEAGRLDLEARPFARRPGRRGGGAACAARPGQGAGDRRLCGRRLPERVIGDATRLRQVLLNLAGNALKFTERGGASVIVEPGIWPDEVRSWCATPASALRPRSRRASSSNSSRPTAAWAANSAGPAWGLRSPSASSSAWAADRR